MLLIKVGPEAFVRGTLERSITRGSRSGRVAWKFIQDLAGRLGHKLERE